MGKAFEEMLVRAHLVQDPLALPAFLDRRCAQPIASEQYPGMTRLPLDMALYSCGPLGSKMEHFDHLRVEALRAWLERPSPENRILAYGLPAQMLGFGREPGLWVPVSEAVAAKISAYLWSLDRPPLTAFLLTHTRSDAIHTIARVL